MDLFWDIKDSRQKRSENYYGKILCEPTSSDARKRACFFSTFIRVSCKTKVARPYNSDYKIKTYLQYHSFLFYIQGKGALEKSEEFRKELDQDHQLWFEF